MIREKIMDTIESMREFLGWCSVINIGILTLLTIPLLVLRDQISRVNAKLFDLGARSTHLEYYRFYRNTRLPYSCLILLRISH